MKNRTKKIAYLSMMLCLALLMGYVEALLPFSASIPGIKLGLSNYAVLLVLFLYGWREAYGVAAMKVVLTGFLFGNLSMMLYGLAGILFAVSGMLAFKKSGRFSMIGISMFGGVLHNLGQWLVAVFVLRSKVLIGYLPWLLLAGMAAGAFVGLLAKYTYPALAKVMKKEMPE